MTVFIGDLQKCLCFLLVSCKNSTNGGCPQNSDTQGARRMRPGDANGGLELSLLEKNGAKHS